MPESLQSVLLNALFLIAPLFLAQLTEDRPIIHKHKSKISFLAAALVIVACMSYPVHTGNGYYTDLRWIPILATHLYHGPTVSAPLVAVVFVYQLLTGWGDTAYIGLAVLSIFCIPPRLFARYGWSALRKALTGGALTGAYVLLCLALTAAFDARYHPRIDGIALLLLLQSGVAICGIALCELYFRRERQNRHQRDQWNEQLEKYGLVSELAASVSHEVRNPLTVTRGFLQLLRSGGQTERTREQYIDMALEELDRAQAMLTDYLRFARTGPSRGDRAVFSADVELAGIASVVTPYASFHAVQIETRLDPDCRIYGNAGKFRQCVVNLCKNAIESMPAGGRMRISLKRDESKKEALLTIQDEGVGMNQEQLDRIGVPYVTTKENGTGLGLSVVTRTVEELGGRLRFYSAVGQGTTVYVCLPLQDPQPREEEGYDLSHLY